MFKTYKGYITELKENEVMVFGANQDGFHGAGMAGYASFGEFGNVWRKYEYDKKPKGWKGRWNEKGRVGPQIGTEGKSYGLVTIVKAGKKRSLSEENLITNIKKFYEFALSRPHLNFFVAQECKNGLNGYTYLEMAKFFSGSIPENVYFEENFAKLLTNYGPNPN